MNKEYACLEGKAIIRDEQGNQRVVENSDKLHEILVKENLIEMIETLINVFEKESKDYQTVNKKKYKPVLLPTMSLMTLFGIPIFMYFLGNKTIFTNSINTIFGIMNEAVFYSTFLSVMFLPFVALIERGLYKISKDNIKNEKAINAELEFLKKQIELERTKLAELKKLQQVNNDKTFSTSKIDDLEQLKLLKEQLVFIKTLGYDYDKYFRFYQTGVLGSRLEELGCDEKQIALANNYFKQKSKVLKR